MIKNYHLICRHYLLILIATLITSVIGGFYTSKLPLKSDLAELLPESFASVKALNEIRKEVGGAGNLRIVLESSDFDALKKFAHHLEPKLLASEKVNYVDYQNDVDFYKKNALLFLELDELDSLEQTIQDEIAAEKQKLNPLHVDDLFGDANDVETEDGLENWEQKYKELEPSRYYINEDSTVLVLRVLPSGSSTSLDFVREMYHEIRSIVESAEPQRFAQDMTVYYGGNYKNRLDEHQVVQDDIFGTAFYGLGAVFLLITIYFRRLLGAILISLTLFASLAWTFGVTYFVIGSLNTITGFLFVILFGLGIDYGIHALARFTESRKSGLSFEDSIEKMVVQTGKALTTTAVTTSAAFFSLMLMDFKGFSELGFISGIGMLFALVAMTIVLPALLTLVEKARLFLTRFFEKVNLLNKVQKIGLLKSQVTHTQSQDFTRRPLKFARPLLIIAVFLTAYGIFSVFNVEFQYDFTNLRAITEEREEVGEKTEGIFTRSESPAVVLTDSKEEIPEVVAALERIMRQDTLTPTIESVRSIYSLVPNNQDERLEKISEIRELVNEEAEGVVTGEDKERLDKLQEYLQVKEPFTWDEFPQNDKRRFINKKGEIGNFVFVYPGIPLRDGKNAIEFRNDVGEFKTESGKVYHAASTNIILAEMLTILIEEGKWAVVLALSVVFVIVLFDLRKLRATLLVLSPLVLGILWMIAFMYLFGLEWNLFNLVVLPSIIGIGVDNGVHIYHRYKEEGPGSLIHVFKNTGWAITMTTSTTIVGYSGLIMARHPGLNSIGNLAVVGLIATYLTAILVLPAMLQFIENRTAANEAKSS